MKHFWTYAGESGTTLIMFNFEGEQYVLFLCDRVHALFQNILFCMTCHHFVLF